MNSKMICDNNKEDFLVKLECIRNMDHGMFDYCDIGHLTGYYDPLDEFEKEVYKLRHIELSSELKSDIDFAFKLIKYDKYCIKLFNDEVQNNEDFIKQLLEWQPGILYYFQMKPIIKVLSSPELVKIVISKYPRLLEFVPNRLKDDEEIIKLACGVHSSAIEYASDRLINSSDFIIDIYSNDANSLLLEYLENSCRSKLLYNSDFINKLIDHYPQDANYIIKMAKIQKKQVRVYLSEIDIINIINTHISPFHTSHIPSELFCNAPDHIPRLIGRDPKFDTKPAPLPRSFVENCRDYNHKRIVKKNKLLYKNY